MTDYIGAAMAKPSDLLQYGRKGMKWGQKIFSDRGGSGSSKGTTDTKAPAAKTGSSTASAPAKRPPGNIQDNVESSSTRYARLDSQAKSGRASDMTEQDLKFYNARTDALAKIAKINETQPSWLRETATKVVQQSAQRQMQTVADALADKYVGDPIKNALKGATESATSGAKTALAPDVKAVVDKVTKKPVVPTAAPKVPGMTREQSLQFFRDNPIANRPLPKNYSPSGNFDLFKTLREEGLID